MLATTIKLFNTHAPHVTLPSRPLQISFLLASLSPPPLIPVGILTVDELADNFWVFEEP